MRPSNFVIALIIVSAMGGLFSLFWAAGNEAYAPSGYDAEQYEVYNQLGALNSTIKETKEAVDDIKDSSSAIDLLTDYIGAAVTAMKTLFKSIDTFTVLVNAGLRDAQLGAAGEILKQMIISIIIIAFFIGGLVAAIMKWRT